MGSFTSATATLIMKALFPGDASIPTNGSLVPITASSTQNTAYKIYNSNGSAGQIGIFCSSSANVYHACHLIKGSNDASSNPTPNGMTDSNFTTNTALGGISGSAGNAGNLSWPQDLASNYKDYKGRSMVASSPTPSGNHTWIGWALSETGNKGQAISTGQIGFPTLATTAGPTDIWGFCITAQGTSAGADVAAPVSGSNLVSANSSGAPIIVAYGDLSSARRLTAGDTPVFATGAITITLE